MGFLRKNRVKITLALNLPFIGDTIAWFRYLFSLSPTDWVWKVKSVGGRVGPIVLVYLASLWWAFGVVRGTIRVWP